MGVMNVRFVKVIPVYALATSDSSPLATRLQASSLFNQNAHIGVYATILQKLSLTYYTHNLPGVILVPFCV